MRLTKSEIRNKEARNASNLGRHAELVSASDGKTLKQACAEYARSIQGDTDRYCFGFSDLEFSASATTIDFFVNGINE